MVWTTITDPQVAAEAPITTGLLTALRDNIGAAFAGLPGAPPILPNVFSLGGSGIDGVGLNPSLGALGYYDFSSLTINTNLSAAPGCIIRVTGDFNLSAVLTPASNSSASTAKDLTLLQALQASASTGQSGGCGVIGAGGLGSTGALGATLVDQTIMLRIWNQRKLLLGGDGGGASGATTGRGGGSIIILVGGNCNFAGGTINCAGNLPTSTVGAGGGGSIIVICAGTLSGGTLTAAGGAGNNSGGGGGGYVATVANAYGTAPALSVAAGLGGGSGANGIVGYAEQVTVPTGVLQGLMARF